MRANDVVETGAAVSWLVLRAALVVVVLVGAFSLTPLIGWSIAASALGVLAVILPQSFAAWGSVACFVIGMLIAGPDPGRTMIAVLVVHLVHVLTTLILVVPVGARIVLRALRPTALRFLAVQAAAQPLTFLVMLGSARGIVDAPWAVVAGAGALVALAVVLIASSKGDGS
jgi:hypothetical protein